MKFLRYNYSQNFVVAIPFFLPQNIFGQVPPASQPYITITMHFDHQFQMDFKIDTLVVYEDHTGENIACTNWNLGFSQLIATTMTMVQILLQHSKFGCNTYLLLRSQFLPCYQERFSNILSHVQHAVPFCSIPDSGSG